MTLILHGLRASTRPGAIHLVQHLGSTTAPPANGPLPEFTFNDLGGGFHTIHVYPGTEDNAADKAFDGTYISGDSMEAICQRNGRTVHSIPGDGEQPRSSATWILIPSAPEEPRFASLVYGDLNVPLSEVPTCTSN